MADKEEASGTSRDWEVVSLTASAYAAAPGPKQVESNDDAMEAETSHPLYMSRHFVFPPSQLDDTTEPSEHLSEIFEDLASKKMESGFSLEQEDGADLTPMKGLDLARDEFEFFEEKSKTEEENIYKTAMTSLQDEKAIGGSHDYEPITPCDVSPPTKDKVAPCETWWKRSAASLISQAKETNTVWSIFIAAAVMGVVILGQRWQQDRCQILQLNWESSIGNEKAGRLMGPISRLKQAFVGGQRRDSFIRVSSPNDS